MILIIKERATPNQIIEMSEYYNGYIKTVIDVEKGILAGGGELHFDQEQELIKQEDSEQRNLWGGGIDIETGEIDYNSMINLRPTQNNPSRDILNQNIRQKFDEITRNLLL